MIEIKKKIGEAVSETMTQVFGESAATAAEIADTFEYPPDSALGDLSLPCFKFSRTLKKAPAQIAQSIAEKLDCEYIREVKCVNGYLNIYIDVTHIAKRVVNQTLFSGRRYGSSDMGEGKTVVLDYSSPNVLKPFHIGHLGTTVIGHSLKLLHQFAGYKCIGINHLGDWGTQFGKIIVAYRKWGDRDEIERGGIDTLVALYVKFHEEAEHDESLNDAARLEFAKLEHGDEENTKLWKWFVALSIEEYKKTYKLLDIEFESYAGESFYTDKMPRQVEILRERGLLTLDDGATIVNLDEYKMPPCLILKRDGTTLYPTRDIAAAAYRADTYHFDKAIYVTSAGQSLHFAQWFKVVELMGYPWYDKLVHVPYGTVSIDGSKLATRTGNVVLLRDLFSAACEKALEIVEEKNPDLENKNDIATAVGTGAIIFHYLSGGRIRDINFKIEDALSFEGNTGPYAQYTYARACSILEKVGFDKSKVNPDEIKTETPDECALAKTLACFPERVQAAIAEYEPSDITRYALDLCAAFNRFYHNCRIIDAESDTAAQTRIALTAATKEVLHDALRLICLKTPEKI